MSHIPLSGDVGERERVREEEKDTGMRHTPLDLGKSIIPRYSLSVSCIAVAR
jgi:hypothetical protein